MKHNPQFVAIVEEAKKEISELSVDEVKGMMDNKEEFTLIDCREQDEWSKGHIQGAKYLGKGVVERDIESQYPNPNEPLVFYCGGGFRSALVCSNLQKMGYTKAISMDGGWRQWKDKGYPTE